ncbi:MAG: flippase-like domain-containing protein, partial [Myxococcales bacterium]|nr:flippase-like domain-containing protein [Myxococcales bacterium]
MSAGRFPLARARRRLRDSCWRLRWLLAAQAIHLSYWDCVKLSFAGNFLNVAAPLGSTAGDVFKAYFVSLHTDRKTEAMTTIVLDRVLGLGTRVLVVALMASMSPADGRLGQFRIYTLVMLAIGIAAVFAYLSPVLRRKLVPRGWLERLPM